MGLFGSKIKVTLINDADGEVFGPMELPPEQLPESFDLQTTMHIGEVDWSVVDAQPMTRAEYKATKSLVLRLIFEIHEQEWTGSGWRNLHVRQTPGEPLVQPIQMATVMQVLELTELPQGLGYHGAEHCISDGFSHRSEGATVYGIAARDQISVLGLIPGETPSAHLATRVKVLAREFEFDLVDWCRCVRVSPDDPRFEMVLFGQKT